MKHILRCNICRTYTIKPVCGNCASTTQNPKPPKFSPEDKFGDYRRKAKKRERKN